MSNYLLLENLVLIVFAVFLGGIVKGSVGYENNEYTDIKSGTIV